MITKNKEIKHDLEVVQGFKYTSITQYYSSEYKRQRREIQDCDDYQSTLRALESIFSRRTSNKNNDEHQNNSSG